MVVLCPYFLAEILVNTTDLRVYSYHRSQAGLFIGNDLTTRTGDYSAIYNKGMGGLYTLQISMGDVCLLRLRL